MFRQLGNSLWRIICLNLDICAAAEDLGALSVFDQSQCKGVAGLAVSGMRQAAAALKELSSNRVGTLDFAAEAESIAAKAAVSLSALPCPLAPDLADGVKQFATGYAAEHAELDPL